MADKSISTKSNHYKGLAIFFIKPTVILFTIFVITSPLYTTKYKIHYNKKLFFNTIFWYSS